MSRSNVWVIQLVLSQTMFLKAIRGFISVSRRRELSTLLEFFNLGQHENQWRISQFYYLRQNPIRTWNTRSCLSPL